MYDWLKPKLGQPVHDLGPRECLGQKQHFRMVALDLRDHPLPERKRLGVRIVDAKDRHALADPVVEDGLQLLPHPVPVFALEIEGINVLIFLGRILRVLNRAVGPLLEPVLVLLHVGMIGRRLERNVQRDGQIRARFAFATKLLKSVHRAQIRMNRFVPAFAEPIAHGLP